MIDEKPKKNSTTLEGLVAALPARIFKRDALAIGVTLLVGASGFALAQKYSTAKVEEITDAKTQPLKKQVDQLQGEVRELKAQMNANEARAAERFDVLYRSLITGRRDPRAEELGQPAPPVKDGGQ